MKNISTGAGIALLAGAIVAFPFINNLASNANASAINAAAAVSSAATGQATPTIVWYQAVGGGRTYSLYRAWSDGRVEFKTIDRPDWQYIGGSNVYVWCNPAYSPCTTPWVVISEPAQGLTYRSDINFDEKVDGADLGQLLADWGNAPRQDIPPSDCPLALINP